MRATGEDGTVHEFYGDLGLATEWLDHPLREAGRGWVSACLFARSSRDQVAVPISLRGSHHALSATPEELESFTLEEGAFYGDYFATPGDNRNACVGEDQASSEVGGLISRDCAEQDPADPTRTLCGFHYEGSCGDFAPEPACKHFSPRDFYRKCDKSREVITVFVLRP